MIIPELGLIFVHIQKTGGNSISAALGQPANDPMKHFTARELRAEIDTALWNSSFKFAFVRNPWDRLVSWWSMINALRADYRAGRALNAFQTTVLSKTESFEDFVRLTDVIVDADGSKSVHRNQIDYLTDEYGGVIVDFVGRFETLESDANAALSPRLGRPVELPRTNRSVRREYREYYTPTLADEVGDIYARDIRAFGYCFGD